MLKNIHSHILEVIAVILNTETSILEDGIIDNDEYVDIFTSFLKKHGKQIIAVQLQEISPPSFGNNLIIGILVHIFFIKKKLFPFL